MPDFEVGLWTNVLMLVGRCVTDWAISPAHLMPFRSEYQSSVAFVIFSLWGDLCRPWLVSLAASRVVFPTEVFKCTDYADLVLFVAKFLISVLLYIHLHNMCMYIYLVFRISELFASSLKSGLLSNFPESMSWKKLTLKIGLFDI